MRFNQRQLVKLADLVADIGLVVLATVALPVFLEQATFAISFAGFLCALVFWALSFYILSASS